MARRKQLDISAKQDIFSRAVLAHGTGDLAGAEALYHQASAADPRNGLIHNNLGALLEQVGRPADAMAAFRQAVALTPDLADAHLNLGRCLHVAGQRDEAAACYQRALERRPGHAQTLLNLGRVLFELGRRDEAIASLVKVVDAVPDHFDALANLAMVHQAVGHSVEAVQCLRNLVAAHPASVDARCRLGGALEQAGMIDQAAAAFSQAIALAPDRADLNLRLGRLYVQLRRWEDCDSSFGRALEIAPDDVETIEAWGTSFLGRGRLAEADGLLARAVALAPNSAVALNNRGTLLTALSRPNEAAEMFRRATEAAPADPELRTNYASCLMMQGLTDDALQVLQGVAERHPHRLTPQWHRCMASLPIIYATPQDVDTRRQAYAQAVEDLTRRWLAPQAATPADLLKGVAASQPFFLAYQGRNDRDLQVRYGALVCDLMAKAALPQGVLAQPPTAGGRIRVGIASAFINNHSNWKIPIRGWVEHLDRERFELFAYSLHFKRDDCTREAMGLFDHFIDGAMPLDQWAQVIRDDALHILIYPEIGMDQVTAQLAALRLAPVQCSSWGHPQTSGYPTIDYFLSSDLMEAAAGQEFYSETLVRLPNLSFVWHPPAAPDMSAPTRAELGLGEGDTGFWCCQSLFKYLPEYDDVFAAIAQRLPSARFFFIDFPDRPHVPELFRRRLWAAFERRGLAAGDYCRFLPRMSAQRFRGVAAQMDVFLDSIGWSGCNSTLETLIDGLPPVTLPGESMRSRHTLAILRLLGVEDTVVATVDDYVDMAIRLATDHPWRQSLSARLKAAFHRILDDRECIRGLEQFLEQAVTTWTATVQPQPKAALHADLHASQLNHDIAANAVSAQLILGMVKDLFPVTSMLDVGCGLGTWLRVAGELGISERLGLDGPWLDLKIFDADPGLARIMDLEAGFQLDRRWDLVSSLEVAEHLAPSAAAGFVASLVRHGDVVLFSAAIPYQGGHHHVNEQFLPYWVKLFAAHGYRPVDAFRPVLWDDNRILWWLRQNMILFVNDAALQRYPKLKAEAERRENAMPLSVVHPLLYSGRVKLLLDEVNKRTGAQ